MKTHAVEFAPFIIAAHVWQVPLLSTGSYPLLLFFPSAFLWLQNWFSFSLVAHLRSDEDLERIQSEFWDL